MKLLWFVLFCFTAGPNVLFSPNPFYQFTISSNKSFKSRRAAASAWQIKQEKNQNSHNLFFTFTSPRAPVGASFLYF